MEEYDLDKAETQWSDRQQSAGTTRT